MKHVVEVLLPMALHGDTGRPEAMTPSLPSTITDACFIASLRMVYKKYVCGQCVLAKTAEEQAWLGRHTEPRASLSDDITPILLQILRACVGACITEAFVLTVSLELHALHI